MERQKKGPEAPPEVRTLLWEGEPVLSFSPPKVPLSAQAPRRVVRYYRRLERMWRERWEGEVYQRACRAAATARAGSRPFEPWQAALTAQVSESEGVLGGRRAGGRALLPAETGGGMAASRRDTRAPCGKSGEKTTGRRPEFHLIFLRTLPCPEQKIGI